jgi:Tfp pilus assembly protein PilX
MTGRIRSNKHLHTREHRGFALLLVLIFMAVATVMAYAMLDNAAIQQQATAGQASASQAEALAESGIELAMYYLQHPTNAPSRVAATSSIPAYWSGGTSISFTGMSGTATVAVAPSGTSGTLWTISSTGSSSLEGITNTKTLTATAQVNGKYQAVAGLTTNVALNIAAGVTINGGIVSIQPVTINVLAHVAGGLLAPLVTGPYSGGLSSPPASNPVPDVASIQSYLTYKYSGSTYNGVAVNVAGNNNVTVANPAGVFTYTGGTVTLTGPMTVHGTLYVPNGGVNFKGNVTFATPTSGFPSIVCSGAISSSSLGSHLTTNGLVYAAGGINSGDLLSSVTMNGGLLTASGGISSSFLGSVSINFNASVANILNLTNNGAYLTPVSVKLIAWNP